MEGNPLKDHRALVNLIKFGEHDSDFLGNFSGSLGVFYLRECLELKHDVISFVEGGMLPEDQFDSLKRASTVELQSPHSKKMTQEMLSTVKVIADKLLDDTASSVDDCYSVLVD